MQNVKKFNLGKTLLVASTGGHLEQLHRFVDNDIVTTDERHWVTFDHSQSRTLLGPEEKTYVPYIPSRGLVKALLAFPKILRIFLKFKPEHVVSTGAAIAIPTAIAALLSRTPMIYIESVSRFEGPSLTGKLLEHSPWVTRYTQHHNWSGAKWQRGPSVLSSYVATDAARQSVKRVFVSLGTIKPYRFDRAIEFLHRVLPRDIDVRLQFGETTGDYSGWTASATIGGAEFQKNIEWADLVILHAGVGSALNVLDSAKAPVLLVREMKFNEHVDDHQSQIASALAGQGLALKVDLTTTTWDEIQAWAAKRIDRLPITSGNE